MSYALDQLRTFARLCIGRQDDFALQRGDGGYYRVGRLLTSDDLHLHLEGQQTIGTYLITERGLCRFAVFDADSAAGLVELLSVQSRLRLDGIASYLEGSRRGGHLRIFLAAPAPAALVRRWLLPYCPAGVEFYPKQESASFECPGSLMRVPFGVHLLSGRRYPFVSLAGEKLVPVVRSVGDALVWLSTVERVQVPDLVVSPEDNTRAQLTTKKISFKKSMNTSTVEQGLSIRDWCLSQDASLVIGRYVALDQRGMGCCPFGWHHSDGRDSHPSFRVYTPAGGDLCCWYCHVLQGGGSLFDFLRLYFDLDARTLWHRILSGEQF